MKTERRGIALRSEGPDAEGDLEGRVGWFALGFIGMEEAINNL